MRYYPNLNDKYDQEYLANLNADDWQEQNILVYMDTVNTVLKAIFMMNQKQKVGLQLWCLHPRKGCSKGVYVENVDQEDLDQVFEYLNSAALRNQKRFSGIVNKFSIV